MVDVRDDRDVSTKWVRYARLTAIGHPSSLQP
jgi:hypothetical protein